MEHRSVIPDFAPADRPHLTAFPINHSTQVASGAGLVDLWTTCNGFAEWLIRRLNTRAVS